MADHTQLAQEIQDVKTEIVHVKAQLRALPPGDAERVGLQSQLGGLQTRLGGLQTQLGVLGEKEVILLRQAGAAMYAA